MSDPKSPKRTEDEDPKKGASQADDTKSEDSGPKSKYVFKVVPSNPKNSLDFEDVADK